MTRANLLALYDQADTVDRREGLLAYFRYNTILTQAADLYQLPLPKVVAVFAALSPNNDYVGNLRSMISVLEAYRLRQTFDKVSISTYRHCGERAWLYLTGKSDFLATVKGLKIRNFYQNILDPSNPEPVTIDGHMVGAYQNSNGTMKELIISPTFYVTIAQTMRELAKDLNLLTNQLQATLWFTRKRVLRIKYQPQLHLFHDADDQWRTLYNFQDIQPFRQRISQES